MVELIGLSFGWLLIILGTIFLLIEATNPGFFIAVPGTVMILLGILLVLGVDIFSSPFGVVIGVGVAVTVSFLTVWLYRRITPEHIPPVTISRDSLVGQEGRVIKKVVPDVITGKVRIGGMEWSARSASSEIPSGARVRVVRSEGVHILVEEVK